MTRDELMPVLDAMRLHGGGFVQALAIAMLRADSENLRILTEAFSDKIQEYKRNFVDTKQ
jgi:hypothetical protein